eukprot:8999615-Pyramimonas_sp.AAC.1
MDAHEEKGAQEKILKRGRMPKLKSQGPRDADVPRPAPEGAIAIDGSAAGAAPAASSMGPPLRAPTKPRGEPSPASALDRAPESQ